MPPKRPKRDATKKAKAPESDEDPSVSPQVSDYGESEPRGEPAAKKPKLKLTVRAPPKAGEDYDLETEPSSAKPEDLGPSCENCNKSTNPVFKVGAVGETLCSTCRSRYYIAAKKAREQEVPIDDSWRKSARKARSGEQKRDRDKDDFTCVTCSRHHARHEQEANCEYCFHRLQVGAPARVTPQAIDELPDHSYAMMRDTAYRQSRLLNPGELFDVEQREPVGPNSYWHAELKKLISQCKERGLQRSRLHRDKDRAIYLLQLDDAYNGILPRPRPVASALQDLPYKELRSRASEAGWYAATGSPVGNATGEQLIDFIQSKRDATDELNAIQEQKLAVIRKAVASVLATLGLSQNAADSITHQTHNGGITGSERALSRLHTTLNNGHYPTWTSSVGFLCGPIALENALHATRVQYYGRTDNEVHRDRITLPVLMGLLFANSEDPAVPNAVGIPTPDYNTYLRDTFGHLDEVEYGHEYTNMTRLNNMDFQQLIAMLVLARRAGLIEEDFSLGIVRGAHINHNGHAVPAFAQIVHEGNENAPTVYLHHNLAASADGYNHFEGFQEPRAVEDFEVAFEWGLATPLTKDAPKQKFSGSTAKHETNLARLRREAKNANSALREYLRIFGRACKPCRESGSIYACKNSGGHRYCDPCADNPDACIWEEGTDESRVQDFKSASELTEEDRQAWLRPLDHLDELEQIIRTQQHLPDPDITSANFFVFGCARKSSHPGAATMMQLMQDLIYTINTYNNVLNNPAYQHAPEGQRPGGPGTPMQSHWVVVARHGTRPVPTHLGNLADPTLRTFVNTMDHILRPNNPHIPLEIHFLLMGTPGFCVDISGWGDRAQGFLRHVLDADATNNTRIANIIYLVFLLEQHVVSPLSPSSINNGQPPHGVRFNNKQIVKVRLVDMIDRHMQLQYQAHTLAMPFQLYMMHMAFVQQGVPNAFPPGIQLPVWPGHLGGLQYAAKLDRMIMAMYWEKAWRSAWLDGNTVPTDAMVIANNNGRNTRM